jgi:hypothetical protein
MYASNPDAITDWIIGRSDPPQAVVAEAARQKDCMLGALVHDAERDGIIADWGDQRHLAGHMPAIVARFDAEKRFQANLLMWWTRSAWRGSQEQSWIWYRKFMFHSNAFNRVSDHAEAKCRIESGRTWNPEIAAHVSCWKTRLSDQEREREILVASAAPGISRHHWGTDFDLFSLNPRNFLPGQPFHDEWTWMRKNAIQHGFIQPYQPHDFEHAYMEERWHWSYAPISQALTRFAVAHQDAIDAALNAQWDAFESRWTGRRQSDTHFFDYVRAHWRDYMFTIATKKP